MKKNNLTGILSIIICVILLLGTISGCAGSTTSSSSPSASASASSSASPSAAAPSGKQTVTDALGNQVTVPVNIKKVYCTSPIGTYILYTLAPDKLLGWNSKMSDATLQYIDPKYKNLSVLGGTMGGQNSINTEAITALNPDIILDFAYNKQVSDMVTQLGKQTGIPVVTLDSALKATPDTYRLLGKILGVEDRGNQLADASKKILDNISSMVAKVPDSEKVKVYYAESADGLSTDGTDSMHTEVFQFVNATNVVTMSTSASGMGTKVSMEQIVNWNPDVIIANSQMGGTDFTKTIYTNPTWAGINAVKNHKVYVPVSVPFNWLDRPPCIARIMGVEWLASELYPKYVTVDLKSDLKSFYKTFYNVDVTDEQANSLLSAAVVK